MKKIFLMMLLVISGALLWSCQETEPSYLFAEQAAILADQEPYKATIEVKSNVEWSVVSEADWCSVYGEKGSYKGSFEVVVDRNTTIEDRTTSIVLTGGGQTFVIPVTQTAASFGFSVPVTDYSVNNQNQTVKIAYVLTRKGASVEAYSSADWAIVKKMGNSVAEIEVGANKTGKVRDAEISLVAMGGTGDPITVKASVTQSASEDILEIFVEDVALGSEGETRKIPVQSNSEMDVLSSESWCIAAADGSFIVISAEANTTGKAREAFVSLSLKDANEGTRTKLIKVTQAASDISLELPITEVTLNRAGDVIKLPFTSDAELTLETGADWCTAAVEGSFIAVSAEQNNTGEARTDYITVKADKAGIQISKLISVTQSTEAIVLDVAAEELLLNSDGEARNIPYSSDCDVTVKSSEPWLKAEVSDGNIAVSAEPNTTASIKEGYITITAAGKGKKVSKSVRVLQSKSEIALELTAEEVLIAKSGEAQTIPFMSTSEVVVESGAEWCSASVSGQFISISASENKSGSARTTYVVVKTNTGTANDIVKSIKVTQASSSVALDIPVTEATLNKYGSEVKLPFTASCEISVESNTDWCSASVKGNYIVIEAEENTSSEERKAIVTVMTESGTDGDMTKIINVTQSTEGLSLEVHSDEVKINKSGDEVKLPFTASGATVSAESGADWCTASVSGQFISFKAKENTSGEERTAYVSVVAKASDGATVTKVVRVIQASLDITLDITSDEVLLAKTGEAQTVPYTASVEDVKAISGADWCKAVVDGQFIRISASTNKTGNTRMTYVVVKTNTGTDNEVTKSIKVTQSYQEVALDLPVTTATLDKQGSEVKLPYTASCTVTAESSASWCEVSVKGNYVVISAEENLSGSDRKALVTVKTVSGTGSDLTETITVTQNTESVTLDVHSDEIALNKAGDEAKVPFTSSCTKVLVESGADWCHATVSGQFVCISADENNTGAARSTFVSVTADAGDGNTATKVIKVSQTIEELFLEIEASEVTIDKSGSSIKVPFSSSSDVIAESGATWCNASISGNFIEISANENKTGKARNCYVKLTTASGSGNEITKTISVTQGVVEYVLEVSVERVVLNSLGDAAKIPFIKSSSSEIAITTGADWLTAAEENGYVKVSAQENKTGEVRTAYITIQLKDVSDDQNQIRNVEVVQTATEVALYVPDTELSFRAAGETRNIPYDCEYAVSVSSSESWLTAGEAKDGMFELKAAANKTGEERIAYVTVKTKSESGSEASVVIKVTQASENLFLELGSSEVELDYDGTVVKVPYSASCEVVAISAEEWCKVNVATDFIEIGADSNEGGSERSCYLTIKTNSGAEKEISRTITVKQLADSPYIELGQEEIEADSNKSQTIVQLSSSGNWVLYNTAEQMPDWVVVSPTEGTGDAMLTISIKANKFARPRSAQLFFKNTDSDLIASLNVSQAENANGIKDYMYLGKGYDVSGLYAEESGVKASVLDCEALANGSHIADLLNYNQTEEDIIYGKTLSEYEKKYTVNAGVSGEYSGFSASVETNFSETAKGSSDYQYATLRHMTKKLCLKLYENETAATLKDCLSEAFLADVETLGVEELLDKYGTHVITGFSLGGVLEYSMAADATEVANEVDWGLAVKAGYEQEAVGKAEASASYSQYNSVKNASNSYESRLKCRGGQSQYASQGTIPTDNSPYSSATYSEWLNSLEDSNLWVLVDYEGSQLIPIWEFISDQDKKNDVKTATTNRLTGVTRSQTSNYKDFRLTLVSAYTNMQDESGSNEFGLTMSVKLDSDITEQLLQYTNTSGNKLNIDKNETVNIGKSTKEYHLKYTADHSYVVSFTGIKEYDSPNDDKFNDVSLTLTYDKAAGRWTYLNSNNEKVSLDDGGTFSMTATYKENVNTIIKFNFKLSWK